MKKKTTQRPGSTVVFKANLREEERRKKLIEAGLEGIWNQRLRKDQYQDDLWSCRPDRTLISTSRSVIRRICLLLPYTRELIDERAARFQWQHWKTVMVSPWKQPLRALKMFYQRFQQDSRRAQIQLF